MQNKRFKYTILKNTDGRYWLWFDERGTVIDGKYVPNLQPYHEIDTHAVLREGAEIWTNDLVSVPDACQLKPMGEYSENYVVKAKIVDESKYLTNPVENAIDARPTGKKPGRG